MSSHKFKIEDRRRQVASLLARSMTQQEIGEKLGVDQSTVSDDVRVLKQMSQRFIFDLARSDLAFYYLQCIRGLDEVSKEAWKMYNSWDSNSDLENAKYRLLALRVAREANESKFKLLSEGPSIMSVQSMSDRLDEIEESYWQQEQQQQEANR